MGEINSNKGTNTYYYSVMNGKLVRKVKPETPGATSRVNKVGATVYELSTEGIEGYFTKIEVEKHDEYGTFLSLWLTDPEAGENYKISVSTKSGPAKSFFFRMLGIDYSKQTKIMPYDFTEDDKRRTGITFYQDDVKIESQHNKDNPNGLPDLEKVVFQGEERWDDSARRKFWANYIKNELPSKMSHAPSEAKATMEAEPVAETTITTAPTKKEEAPFIGEEDDDLPF